jgi:hypothetical protein
MRTNTVHAEINKQKNFSDIAQEFANALGYEPVLMRARQTIQERLRSLGLISPYQNAIEERQEALISSDGMSGLLLRFSISSDDRKQHLDMLTISTEELPDILATLEEVLGHKTEPGTTTYSIRMKRLSSRLGNLSPNGKNLADPTARNIIRRLYDDQLRRDVIAIVGTVGSNPVSLKLLEQMELFTERANDLNKILTDDTLTSKQYVVYCESCQLRHLAFSSNEKAKYTVRDAGKKCVSCGEIKLSVEESYTVSDALIRGIQNGLWLESLVADIFSGRMSAVWAGQMIENNEVDILSIYSDKVVLVECKDTSFGQNDLYVTAMKADHISADRVIIVTTRDIHPNVNEAANKIKSNSNRRSFLLISKNTTEEITCELNKELDIMQERYVKSWTTGGGGVFSEAAYRLGLRDFVEE